VTRRARVRLTILAATLTATGVARAEEPPTKPPLRWDPAWTHVGPFDYALGAGGLVALGVETLLLQSRFEPPRWEGPILFDKPVEVLFRGQTQEVRDGAADASWVLWSVELGYPLLVDVPYTWVRFGRAVAWDLLWQDAVALSLSSVVDFTLRDVVARVRPINQTCLDRDGTNCLDSPEATRAFPSGHVSETSTATALICSQHLMMRLYGSPWDAVTCASAIGAAAAVDVLRLVTDNHYLSDELAGVGIGLAFGWGLPVLMHLHGHATRAGKDEEPSALAVPFPLLVDHGAGVGVTAIF
jgi:membrane-associated phospholipid phosphatase